MAPARLDDGAIDIRDVSAWPACLVGSVLQPVLYVTDRPDREFQEVVAIGGVLAVFESIDQQARDDRRVKKPCDVGGIDNGAGIASRRYADVVRGESCPECEQEDVETCAGSVMERDERKTVGSVAGGRGREGGEEADESRE